MRKVLQSNIDHNFRRWLSTSSVNSGMRWDRIKAAFVKSEDLDKRPSDAEIVAKNLPPNTPTLRERIKRDHIGKFYEMDKKAGYYLGETGTWRDFVDANLTIKDAVKIGFSQLKDECDILVKDIKTIDND